MLFDVGRSIPVILLDRSILRHPVEAYGRLLTPEPDEKGLVYYAYDADGRTFGGSYKPKESSVPYLKTGEAITVTYSQAEPWKHELTHEVSSGFRGFLFVNSLELVIGFALLAFFLAGQSRHPSYSLSYNTAL